MKHIQILAKIIDAIDRSIGRQRFAIVVIAISQLIFPLAFLYVSQHDVNPIITNLTRGIVTVLSHAIIFFYFGYSFDLPNSQDIKWLIIRCTIAVFHQIVYTGLYYVLSFPVLNTLGTTGPLFVFVLDYFINSIKINKKQLIGLIFGVIGVIITINGDLIMSLLDDGYEIVSDFKNYKVTDIRLKVLFALFLVFCNALWAYSVIVQKRISHINGLQLSFYMGIQFIISSGVIYSFGVIAPISAVVFVQSCLYTGCIATLVQIMLICSLNLSKNSGILTLSVFLNIITSTLISHYRFGEKENPLSIAGMLLLVYGVAKTTLSKDK